MEPGRADPRGAPRVLTLANCIGIGINGIVGSGIFLLPPALFRRAGGAAPLAWLLAGGFCMLVALTFAEAASTTDRHGGPYRYAVDAFGPVAGFSVGFITLASSVLGYAAVARAFGDQLVDYSGHGGAKMAIAIGATLVATLGAINVRGVRPGARTADLTGTIKVLALGAFVVLGLLSFRPVFDAPPAPAPGESSGLLSAALAGLFALTGFEYVPVPAGEMARPKRDVGLSMVASVLGATLLYVAIQVVLGGSHVDLAHTTAALPEAAGELAGPSARTAMAGLALVSTFGFCASSALVAPRYVESLSDDGFFPPSLGRRSSRQTPATAVVATSLVVIGLSATLDFGRLADISVVAIVVQYLATSLAVLKLRRTTRSEFRLPFGSLVPALSAVLSIGFFFTARGTDVVAGAVLLAVGSGIGWVRRARFPRSVNDSAGPSGRRS